MNETITSFWSTCHQARCVEFSAGFADGPDWAPPPWNTQHQFIGAISNYQSFDGFRVTSWTLDWQGDMTLAMWYGDSAWNQDVVEPGHITVYTTELDWAAGGPNYEGALWQGFWLNGVPDYGTMQFDWQGETVAAPRLETVVTPEPSVVLMLAPAFMFLYLLIRRRRR